MNDLDRPSELIIELAKAVVAEMRACYPTWKEAFVRMQADDGSFEIRCSYVLPSGVHLLDGLAHDQFVSAALRVGADLRDSLSQSRAPFCVAILRVGSDLDYEMQYEYVDSGRWRISKLGGGTGIPAGYIPA